MKKFKWVLALLLIFVSVASAAKIELKNIKRLLDNSDRELKGFIRNPQIAPFNNNVISFELHDDEEISLYIMNVQNGRYLEVESKNYHGKDIKRLKFPEKNQGLVWHPSKNWFVFYGNGTKNRDNLYAIEVVMDRLLNKYAVKGYKFNLPETRGTQNRYPDFDYSGLELCFSRKEQSGENYDICVIKDFDLVLNSKNFKDLTLEKVISEDFDQMRPKFYPGVGRNLIAYNSYKNDRYTGYKKNYAEYTVNLYDIDSKKLYQIDKCDGYDDYPTLWSKDGSYIYYFKSLPLIETPQEFIDKNPNVNIVDLYYADVFSKDGEVKPVRQTNLSRYELSLDVSPKSIGNYDDTGIVISDFQPGNTLSFVDVQGWMLRKEDYKQNLPIEYGGDYPFVLGDKILYVGFVFEKYRDVDVLYIADINIDRPKPQVKTVASQKDITGDMDMGGYGSDNSAPDNIMSDEPITNEQIENDSVDIEKETKPETPVIKEDNKPVIKEEEPTPVEPEDTGSVDDSEVEGMAVVPTPVPTPETAGGGATSLAAGGTTVATAVTVDPMLDMLSEDVSDDSDDTETLDIPEQNQEAVVNKEKSEEVDFILDDVSVKPITSINSGLNSLGDNKQEIQPEIAYDIDNIELEADSLSTTTKKNIAEKIIDKPEIIEVAEPEKIAKKPRKKSSEASVDDIGVIGDGESKKKRRAIIKRR